MKKYLVIIVFISILLIFLSTQACGSTSNSIPTSRTDFSDFPVYDKAKTVKISIGDAERLVVDYFGYAFTLYQNTLDLRLSTDEYATIYPNLENKLIDKGWRDESAFGIEAWKNNTKVLFLDLKQLSSSDIDTFRRSYGVKDIEAGQILIITYVIDTDQLLPNPTETAEAEAHNRKQTEIAITNTNEAYQYLQQKTNEAYQYQQQKTSEAIEKAKQGTQTAINSTKTASTSTQEAYQYQQKKTSEAIEEGKQGTQTAINATKTASTSTQQAIAQVTQTALEQELQQQAIQATSMALKPILDQISTEFDESSGLPLGMRVEREDPTRWDLTSKPGWLHISARYTEFYDKNMIPKNVFVFPLIYTNISIITRVDGTMSRETQGVYFGLTPKSYETLGYTVEMGITLKGDKGRSVYAWACFEDSCWSRVDFSDQIRFSGPVYLRLDVAGLTYTFYYSENGVDWIYLGKSDGYAAGDRLFLNAGGGNSYYHDEEFDAYFDFLRFKPLISNQ